MHFSTQEHAPGTETGSRSFSLHELKAIVMGDMQRFQEADHKLAL